MIGSPPLRPHDQIPTCVRLLTNHCAQLWVHGVAWPYLVKTEGRLFRAIGIVLRTLEIDPQELVCVDIGSGPQRIRSAESFMRQAKGLTGDECFELAKLLLRDYAEAA